MTINAYVVGTLVIVFSGIALYRMGHSGIATYHGTRKSHQLGSWALVLRKKWGRPPWAGYRSSVGAPWIRKD